MRFQAGIGKVEWKEEFDAEQFQTDREKLVYGRSFGMARNDQTGDECTEEGVNMNEFADESCAQ